MNDEESLFGTASNSQLIHTFLEALSPDSLREQQKQRSGKQKTPAPPPMFYGMGLLEPKIPFVLRYCSPPSGVSFFAPKKTEDKVEVKRRSELKDLLASYMRENTEKLGYMSWQCLLDGSLFESRQATYEFIWNNHRTSLTDWLRRCHGIGGQVNDDYMANFFTHLFFPETTTCSMFALDSGAAPGIAAPELNPWVAPPVETKKKKGKKGKGNPAPTSVVPSHSRTPAFDSDLSSIISEEELCALELLLYGHSLSDSNGLKTTTQADPTEEYTEAPVAEGEGDVARRGREGNILNEAKRIKLLVEAKAKEAKEAAKEAKEAAKAAPKTVSPPNKGDAKRGNNPDGKKPHKKEDNNKKKDTKKNKNGNKSNKTKEVEEREKREQREMAATAKKNQAEERERKMWREMLSLLEKGGSAGALEQQIVDMVMSEVVDPLSTKIAKRTLREMKKEETEQREQDELRQKQEVERALQMEAAAEREAERQRTTKEKQMEKERKNIQRKQRREMRKKASEQMLAAILDEVVLTEVRRIASQTLSHARGSENYYGPPASGPGVPVPASGGRGMPPPGTARANGGQMYRGGPGPGPHGFMRGHPQPNIPPRGHPPADRGQPPPGVGLGRGQAPAGPGASSRGQPPPPGVGPPGRAHPPPRGHPPPGTQMRGRPGGERGRPGAYRPGMPPRGHPNGPPPPGGVRGHPGARMPYTPGGHLPRGQGGYPPDRPPPGVAPSNPVPGPPGPRELNANKSHNYPPPLGQAGAAFNGPARGPFPPPVSVGSSGNSERAVSDRASSAPSLSPRDTLSPRFQDDPPLLSPSSGRFSEDTALPPSVSAVGSAVGASSQPPSAIGDGRNSAKALDDPASSIGASLFGELEAGGTPGDLDPWSSEHGGDASALPPSSGHAVPDWSQLWLGTPSTTSGTSQLSSIWSNYGGPEAGLGAIGALRGAVEEDGPSSLFQAPAAGPLQDESSTTTPTHQARVLKTIPEDYGYNSTLTITCAGVPFRRRSPQAMMAFFAGYDVALSDTGTPKIHFIRSHPGFCFVEFVSEGERMRSMARDGVSLDNSPVEVFLPVGEQTSTSGQRFALKHTVRNYEDTVDVNYASPLAFGFDGGLMLDPSQAGLNPVAKEFSPPTPTSAPPLGKGEKGFDDVEDDQPPGSAPAARTFAEEEEYASFTAFGETLEDWNTEGAAEDLEDWKIGKMGRWEGSAARRG